MPFMPSACFYNFTWKTKGKKRGNITYTMQVKYVYRPKYTPIPFKRDNL